MTFGSRVLKQRVKGSGMFCRWQGSRLLVALRCSGCDGTVNIGRTDF